MVLDSLATIYIGPPLTALLSLMIDGARVVQGERRAELARAMLSRSPHSQSISLMLCKGTTFFARFQISMRLECKNLLNTRNDTFPHRKRTVQPRQKYRMGIAEAQALISIEPSCYFVTCDFVTLSTLHQSSAKSPYTIYKLYIIIIIYNFNNTLQTL